MVKQWYNVNRNDEVDFIKKILSLILLIVSSFILYGCSVKDKSEDKLTEKEEKFLNLFCENLIVGDDPLLVKYISSLKIKSIDASYKDGLLIKYNVSCKNEVGGNKTITYYMVTRDYTFYRSHFTDEERRYLLLTLAYIDQFNIDIDGITLYKGNNFEKQYIPDDYTGGTKEGFVLRYLIGFKWDGEVDMNVDNINKALKEYKKEKGWIE